MDVVLEKYGFDGENALDVLGARARPPLVFAMWDGILADTLAAERRLFATQRGWPNDKPATRERKARDKDPRVRANAGRVNVATGALREHMTTRGAGAQPLKMDADELRIGVGGAESRVFYARFQAKHGRDPLVSRAVMQRIAGQGIREHLLGR